MMMVKIIKRNSCILHTCVVCILSVRLGFEVAPMPWLILSSQKLGFSYFETRKVLTKTGTVTCLDEYLQT